MSDKITWTNDKRKLSELIPWDINPAQIGKDEAKRLEESLAEFGQIQTIAISPANEILDGHQRQTVWGASRKFGMDYEVDVRVSSRELTEQERKKLVIYLRKGTVGQFDFDLLANNWNFDDLLEWGFDEKELLGLDFGKKPPADDSGVQIDKAEELQKKWQVQPGDLWEMDEHLLYCGDAKDANIQCDFAIYDSSWDWSLDQQQEMMDWVQWKNSLVMGTSNCFGLATRDDYISFLIWDELTGVGISNQSKYLSHRSLILLLWFGERERFYKYQALRILHETGLAQSFHADIPQYIPIVRKYTDSDDAFHSSCKPAALCDFIISLYSRPGDIIGDPFAGSGSFLLSCQRLKRKYHGAELEPKYCSVILERFEYEFGITAEKVA